MTGDLDWWRNANSVLMGLAFIGTVIWWIRNRKSLSTVRVLRMMALSMALLTGAYGSWEAANSDTLFRVPMTTFTAIWSLIAVFAKEEENS